MSLPLARFVLSLLLGLYHLHQAYAQNINIPGASNETLFISQRFQRACIYTGQQGSLEALEWQRNDVIEDTSGSTPLPLLINSVSAEHVGEYTCQARLTNGSLLGPLSAGYLNVLDPDVYIDAPSEQFAILNDNITLLCEPSDPAHEAVVSWLRNGSIASSQLLSVSLEDEGTYTCNAYFFELGPNFDNQVELKVLIPPSIVSSPPVHQQAPGKQPLSLLVSFQSRFSDSTTVSWYKDGAAPTGGDLQTEFSAVPSAETRLEYPSSRREHGGRYLVAVENNHPEIPENLRRVEVTFNVTVVVPPVAPTNVNVSTTSYSGKVNVTWTLTPTISDEIPESLTLTLQYSDQSVAQEHILPGSQTHYVLDVIPGMQYGVLVSSYNQDGNSSAELFLFQTNPAPPSISSLEIVRVNATTFELSLTLNYTGGGDITDFTATFRINQTSEWIPAEAIIPFQRTSDLTLRKLFQVEGFSIYDTVEFRVTLENEAGHQTLEVMQEQLFIPGAPADLSLQSSSSSSLTLSILLSQVGTPPILRVVIEVVPLPPSPHTSTLHNASGPFLPGGTVQVDIGGLESSTEYLVTAYSVNRAGDGPSIQAKFSTGSSDESSSDSLPVIIIAPVVGVVFLVVVVIVTCVILVCCLRRRKEKNVYYPRSTSYLDQEKKLDANHEMINRHPNKGFATLSGSLTPRSPTTANSSRDGRFPFENSSNDSDGSVSEVPSVPRYAYRVSPSPMPGESTHTSLHSLQLPHLQPGPLSNTYESLLSPPPHTPSFATNV